MKKLNEMQDEIIKAYKLGVEVYVHFNGFKVPVRVTCINRATVGTTNKQFSAEFTLSGMPIADEDAKPETV